VWEFREGVHSCLGDLDGPIGGGCVRVLKGRWRPIPRIIRDLVAYESTLRHSAKPRTDTKARVLVCGFLEQGGEWRKS